MHFLDLSNPGFNHTNITFTVVKVPGGDGLANVGAIFGGTNDFGTITIKGDLGKIDAGSATPGTPAIKSLTVRSMGRYGTDTQNTDTGDHAPTSDALVSTISGGLGTLKVTGDVKDVWINVIGGSGIGSVTIGGSLIGGNALPVPAVNLDQKSGVISSGGDIKMVKIGGDVRGGDAHNMLGDAGTASGAHHRQRQSAERHHRRLARRRIRAGQRDPRSKVDMGTVKIGRSVVGGTGAGSGVIQSVGKLKSLTIGGSLLGGSATDSGEISTSATSAW